MGLFVPITLMVLASFLLGLAVGWVAWRASNKRTNNTPADLEPVEPTSPAETTSRSTEPSVQRSTFTGSSAAEATPKPVGQDVLPVWEIQEVHLDERER